MMHHVVNVVVCWTVDRRWLAACGTELSQ